MLAAGIVLSIVAMLSWGFGDFPIQKSTRKIGDWETLFIITLFGAVVLLPFSIKGLGLFFSNIGDGGYVFLFASILLLFAAIIDFEALRRGKLAIVEPIWSFEIPTAAVLAYLILGEGISVKEIILIAILMVFLALVAFRENRFSKKLLFERGIFLAILGAVFMGSANFFIGWGARVVDPILINFVTDAFLCVVSLLVLIVRGKMSQTIRDTKNNIGILLPMSIADKVAWLAFAFAMVSAPIAIATALSESYIIVAVILGVAVNREKLHFHQKLGLAGAVLSAIVLSVLSSG